MFATINDKGCPLTDTDIFKSVLYKQALSTGGITAKDAFLVRWEEIERRANNIFNTLQSKKATPFAFAFLTYSYKWHSYTVRRQLRNLYAKDNYARLKNPQTLDNIFAMLDFLQDLQEQNQLRFSPDTLRRAYILFRFNNAVCYHALVYYFFSKCDENYQLNDDDFKTYLDNVIAFFLGATCTGSGTNFTEHGFNPIKCLADCPSKIFHGFMASRAIIENNLRNFFSMRGKTFCRQVVLNWWAFKNENQELVDLDTKFTYEHIFPKKRLDFEPMDNPNNIELLGNIALLEKSVNCRASDYRFADKKKFYIGFANSSGIYKRGTCNRELQQLAATKNDFTEADIIDRNEQIIAEILTLLDKHGFLQK